MLTNEDWIVFTIVFVITIGAVVYGNKLRSKQRITDQKTSFLDTLLMGRTLTLPMFIGTLVATWYGGIFGVTQIAFEKGIYNFLTQGIFWYVTYIIFALWIVGRCRKDGAVTLPELVGKMFGPKAAKLSAVFTFFNVLPIAYAISLGLFLQLLWGGELWVMIALGVSLAVAYSFYGGFRAVVFSDLVQFFVMCSGVILVFIFSMTTFGGMDFLQTKLPSAHFSFTGGQGILTTMVWGFIALSTLVDPNFYQRCFAASSTKVARRGILLSTVIWLFFDICTTAGGMYAAAVIPKAASNQAYMLYSMQLLPNGLRGFFLAGILATILSTLDSYLFTAGTTISYDLVPKKWRGKVRLQHLGVVVVGVLAILLANMFEGNIRMVWKTLGSYSAACLLLPVMIGYCWPNKISDWQFVFMSILGVIFTTYWRNTEHQGFWQNVDDLYIGILGTCLGLFIIYVVNVLSNYRLRYLSNRLPDNA